MNNALTKDNFSYVMRPSTKKNNDEIYKHIFTVMTKLNSKIEDIRDEMKHEFVIPNLLGPED
jgi:hypothetical protein